MAQMIVVGDRKAGLKKLVRAAVKRKAGRERYYLYFSLILNVLLGVLYATK